jgi:hypothetical protein
MLHYTYSTWRVLYLIRIRVTFGRSVGSIQVLLNKNKLFSENCINVNSRNIIFSLLVNVDILRARYSEDY